MVKNSSVGDNLSMLSGNWSFEGIENQFDEHAKKSIPFYVESHVITKNLTEYFLSDEPTILDIGCSTGTLLSGFHKLHGAKKDKLSLMNGSDEIDLIYSGLNDMMVEAYQQIRTHMRRSKLPNLRVAAYKYSLEKIASAYDTIAL